MPPPVMMTKPPSQMLALVHTGHDRPPTVRSVSRPKAPEGQLLVKIAAAAIQPSDILNAKGSFGSTTSQFTPGRDFSGVVEEGPPNLKGRAVLGSGGKYLSYEANGSHAEYCVVPADGVVLKPDAISFVQAGIIGMLRSVLHVPETCDCFC